MNIKYSCIFSGKIWWHEWKLCSEINNPSLRTQTPLLTRLQALMGFVQDLWPVQRCSLSDFTILTHRSRYPQSSAELKQKGREAMRSFNPRVCLSARKTYKTLPWQHTNNPNLHLQPIQKCNIFTYTVYNEKYFKNAQNIKLKLMCKRVYMWKYIHATCYVVRNKESFCNMYFYFYCLPFLKLYYIIAYYKLKLFSVETSDIINFLKTKLISITF